MRLPAASYQWFDVRLCVRGMKYYYMAESVHNMFVEGPVYNEAENLQLSSSQHLVMISPK